MKSIHEDIEVLQELLVALKGVPERYSVVNKYDEALNVSIDFDSKKVTIE